MQSWFLMLMILEDPDTLFSLINRRAIDAEIRNWFTIEYITTAGKTLNVLI